MCVYLPMRACIYVASFKTISMNQLEESTMAERQPSMGSRKRERQPISIPFVWEERPGMPKKDWKPTTNQPSKPVTPPVKLVVSVPFGWEEKPGTPLPSFVHHPTETTSAPSSQQPSIILPLPLPSPPSRCPEHSRGNWSASYGGRDDQGGNEGDRSSDTELDACSFETYDSFSSAQSLLANGLISNNALSSAVPAQLTSLALTCTNGEQLQSPGSPDSETESIASSYATGTASFAGASFLEWLFPLLAPNSSGSLETGPSQRVDVQGKEFLHENNRSQDRRPLLTLGELIVMSRRRSCQRKVLKMPKQTSMDFMKRNAFGCCIFGNNNGIKALHIKWKRQLQLKLM